MTRTFFRYFDSKMAVLQDRRDPGSAPDPGHQALIDAIVARPAHESPLEALRAVLGPELVALFADTTGTEARRLRLVLSDPRLHWIAREHFSDHRLDLTVAFARRLGVHEQALAPSVLAGACIETISIAFETWLSTGTELSAIPTILDEAWHALGTLA